MTFVVFQNLHGKGVNHGKNHCSVMCVFWWWCLCNGFMERSDKSIMWRFISLYFRGHLETSNSMARSKSEPKIFAKWICFTLFLYNQTIELELKWSLKIPICWESLNFPKIIFPRIFESSKRGLEFGAQGFAHQSGGTRLVTSWTHLTWAIGLN